jgi:hypothetical protein
VVEQDPGAYPLWQGQYIAEERRVNLKAGPLQVQWISRRCGK